MNIKSVKCPNCGAVVDIKDGFSNVYCKFCGSQLVVEEENDTLIVAKVRVKEIEHETERTKMAYENERFNRVLEAKEKDKNTKRLLIFLAVDLAVVIGIALLLLGSHTSHVKKMEDLIVEIQEDIDAGRFDEAEVKVEAIRDDDFSSEDAKRWKETRKTLEKQIKEARKEAEKAEKAAKKEAEKAAKEKEKAEKAAAKEAEKAAKEKEKAEKKAAKEAEKAAEKAAKEKEKAEKAAKKEAEKAAKAAEKAAKEAQKNAA